MGFSFPFFKSRKKNKEYFGLYLTDSSAYGFLFSTSGGKKQILAQNAFSLTSGFENILEDIDNVISDIELKTDKSVDQTIFFLHSWMIDEETYEIKEPYKEIIKKLAKDLELTPLGYIDVEEALSRNLKQQSILNAVAVEVNKSKLGIFIYKGGKKIHHQYTPRTDDVGDDIESVLQDLPKHVVIPHKLYIYGDDDKAEVSSILATYEWEEKVFPQHPMLEVVKQQDINNALVSVFANELLGQSTDAAQASSPSDQKKSDLASKPVSQQNMGFVIGQDVMKIGQRGQRDNGGNGTTGATGQPTVPTMPTTTQGVPESLEGKPNPLSAFIQSMKKIVSGNNNKKTYALFGGIAIIFILFLFVYEYYLHTLTITIFLKSNQVDKTIDLEIPIKETKTKELAVIKNVTANTYSQQKKVTGVREVGKRATGEVVVHNFDTGERAFTRGTKITYKGLIFTLDHDIKVASASGITSDGLKKSGKTKVAVTAQDIGKEYNVPSGTQFTVESLPKSLYIAIADSAFKGGTKKKVSTVSKQDMQALEQKVENLATKGSDDVLGASISQDDILLSSLTSASLGKTTFSKEVGEAAKTLTLNAESEIEFYSLSKKLLRSALAARLENEIEKGFTIDASALEFSIDDVEEDGDTAYVSVDTKAPTYKKIDTKSIVNIAQRSTPGSVKSKIKELYEVEDIKLSGMAWTPFFGKNITVETKLK